MRNRSHTRPNGESALVGIQRIKGNVYAAENIAWGSGSNNQSCSQVMTSWYNSTGHRNNMVNANLTRVGIAGYRYNGTMYWVQVFSS